MVKGEGHSLNDSGKIKMIKANKRSFKTSSYYIFFLSHDIFSNFIQADVMKESVLYSIRGEAGLGDPPTEYTTNDVEAGNFVIKHKLEFNPHNPTDFIRKLKELIDLQFRNEDRAIFDKGP